MKVLTGHLTQTDKSIINQMFILSLKSAKSKRKFFHITEENGIYTVKIQQNDRGLIPCPGSELRLSTNTATFKIN